MTADTECESAARLVTQGGRSAGSGHPLPGGGPWSRTPCKRPRTTASGCARLAQRSPRANMGPEFRRLFESRPARAPTLGARGGFRYTWGQARDGATGKALLVHSGHLTRQGEVIAIRRLSHRHQIGAFITLCEHSSDEVAHRHTPLTRLSKRLISDSSRDTRGNEVTITLALASHGSHVPIKPHA